MGLWGVILILSWQNICRVLLDWVTLLLGGLTVEVLTVKMMTITVVLIGMELVVGVSWRVVMAVVCQLVTAIWVVASALEGWLVVAVIPVLVLSLVVKGMLLENNFRRLGSYVKICSCLLQMKIIPR